MSVFECIGYRLSGRGGAAPAEKSGWGIGEKTLLAPSFRGASKMRTRNLEIPGSLLSQRPGMTVFF